ncbi:4Fe-4S binding protein [Hornefia butyriciproducens]|uniref:4Fe-4S binding protein n=1 Tax=Hornefia butyriciproducens TaxID=2652293 RepID=UPI002A90FE4B|nr:4Fe-4S binding protein [Hornefia butyriciproducens]MDY5423211.1 4Fe-4S binding protein [Hornefia butyriciproducens]
MPYMKIDGQAEAIVTGVEDKFHYVITDSCVACGTCAGECPVGAITNETGTYQINPELCIDCGTCSVVCPVGAAIRLPRIRESIDIDDIDMDKCYFNPGCALSLYKPDVPQLMLNLLNKHFGNVKFHNTCCRHDPKLESGSTIINNCAGCDRRFRSLYEGINTISYWEIIDSIPGLELPDHSGLTVSIHDSCGYRHKPQVHEAIRSLLRKMNINIVEAEYSGTESVCCGDNFYGYVPNTEVQERIRMRAEQFPCQDVVVYCIGCVRAMIEGGKTPRYLPDLLFDRTAEAMPDTLDEYHSKLVDYIELH